VSTNEEKDFGEIIYNAFMSFFIGGLALMLGLDIIYSTLGHINPFGYLSCACLTLFASTLNYCIRS
jgi:hypothetical protein